jgi:hypothetical protein
MTLRIRTLLSLALSLPMTVACSDTDDDDDDGGDSGSDCDNLTFRGAHDQETNLPCETTAE